MSSYIKYKDIEYEFEDERLKIVFWDENSQYHDGNVAHFQVYDKMRGYNLAVGHRAGVRSAAILAHVFKWFVCRALRIEHKVRGSIIDHEK